MPPSGKRGGRGRGEGRGEGGGRAGGAGPAAGGGGEVKGAVEPRRAGAGRGLPDYKENPRARQAGGAQAAPAPADSEANGAEEGTAAAPAQKFNAQEAAEWMAQRYQAVMEEYDKQKASGKKGDIQNFSELNSERSAWTASKPVLPGKEDFIYQLQMALAPYRARQGDDPKGSSA
mmetsp:Transcript_46043/g.119098  ORF Transcript_46043/g.119098 Transcript_46043/m.119098 type:complete len:175 (+) Transcript_46043:86-610(+)